MPTPFVNVDGSNVDVNATTSDAQDGWA